MSVARILLIEDEATSREILQLVLDDRSSFPGLQEHVARQVHGLVDISTRTFT